MKRLNFYPVYEEYLRSKKKTTTFRLGNYGSFKRGDEMMVSIGWDESNTVELHPGRIREVYRRRVGDLNEIDFQGESPDCRTPETAKLVLGCIYRTIVRDEDELWVVKFDHV